jgi:ABC-type sugar transport system substrate-binding protein
MAADATGLPVLFTQDLFPAAGDVAAQQSQIRTCAGRGPPSFLLG